MQPNIMKAGLCSTVSAAVVVSLTGLVPVQANATPEPAVSDQLAGKTIFLDPGHQGSAHSENLSRQVDNGRGGTKDCQTTGMTSLNGVPEHTINWQVAQLVQASLEALGADVVLSRADDSGWGGCVDDRARAANASGAQVAVSIHADSAPADQRGFHLIVPALPIPNPAADQAQSGPGRAVSTVVRDAYLASGFPAATYAGVDNGLQTRDDIAGPALTQVPMVFVEMGNGANPEDAALLESREGQLKHAVAIATGVVGYLLDKPVTATPAAFSPAPGRVPVSTTAEPSATTTPSKSADAVDPDGAAAPTTGAAAPAESTEPSASGTTTKSAPVEDESSGMPTTTSTPADAADPNAPSTVTTTKSAPAPADSGSASDRPAAYFPARVPVSTGVPTTTPSEAADPSATVTTTKSAPAPADSGSAADRPEAAAPALVPTSTPSKPADAAEPTGTATPTPAPTTTTAPAAAGQAGSTPGADSTGAEPTESEADPTPLPEEPTQDGAVSTTTPAPTSTRAPAEEPASDAGQPQSTSTVPTTTVAAPARPVSAAPKPPAGSSGHFQVPGGNEGRPPSGSGGQLAVPPSPEPARAGTGTQVRTAAPGEPAAPAAPSPRKRETTPKTQATPEEELPDLSSLGGPILKVMDMLMPLAQSLGMDNTMITNQLINLAYTLVGMVFGPTK
ncbi:N-acetylmuramoyl-L-alanine amidase [Nocardia neocaledoniensis]|uniref:N-acetylmuramoyl-L-alanine amidase n=1 Tax=Nocardia neocaledoniensis TaxID=236511 RepID=UPI003CC800F3